MVVHTVVGRVTVARYVGRFDLKSSSNSWTQDMRRNRERKDLSR